MTPSITLSIAASVAVASSAAGLCLATGGGWLLALAIYWATGTVTLTGLSLASAQAGLVSAQLARAEARRFA